jgi:hypothetical protein
VSTIGFLTHRLNAELPSSLGMDLAKTVVYPIKQVAPRSTIRGFKDDYYDVATDVVVLAGETHFFRKPVSNPSRSRVIDTQPGSILKGAMRFTGEPARANLQAWPCIHLSFRRRSLPSPTPLQLACGR